MSDKEENIESASANNEESKNSDDPIPLPPPIPLSRKRNSTRSGNRAHIPKIDSGVLFQSNNLLNTNPSLDRTASSQIPLFTFTNDSNFNRTNGSIEQFHTKQLAAKQPEYPPAIKVSSYFNDLFRREIKAPHFKTKDELFNFVEPYSIENYASKYFRKPGFLFFSTQNIQELTTFSDKPLSKPLLEKIPVTKKAIVEKLSTFILNYTDVIKDPKQDEYYKRRGEDKRDNLTLSIVRILHEDGSLVDEFIMQLIKSMRNSPTPETLHLSWKLFLIIITMFYVDDPDVSNVVRWFFVHRIFEEDLEGKYARFGFIKFYERIVHGRNFDVGMQKNDILRIPLGVQFGRKMFKCSLYQQMWNQKRRFPKLPIPLTVYLVVKALIKNGVMVTPKPFPDFGMKTTSSSNSKSSNLSNENNEKNTAESNNSKFFVNEEFNDIEMNNQKEEEESKEKIIKSNDDDNENISKWKNENCSRKANLKLVKQWAAKLNGNFDIINDGEVCNLMGLLFTWMLNLLDPIIPKKMADFFIDTFGGDSDEKCGKFVNNLPLLHLNTLKYLIGFFREIAQNEKFTLETHQTIADNLGPYFVRTSFATIDPFTRQKMALASPRFLLYCLNNLDVRDVYPLNPACEVQKEI